MTIPMEDATRPREERIRVTRSVLRELRRAAAAAAPEEACGLLLGRREPLGCTLLRPVMGENIAPLHREERFVLGAAVWLEAHELAESLDLSILGVWHSHPNASARPSRADLDGQDPSLVSCIFVEDGPTRTPRLVTMDGRELEVVAEGV